MIFEMKYPHNSKYYWGSFDGEYKECKKYAKDLNLKIAKTIKSVHLKGLDKKMKSKVKAVFDNLENENHEDEESENEASGSEESEEDEEEDDRDECEIWDEMLGKLWKRYNRRKKPRKLFQLTRERK